MQHLDFPLAVNFDHDRTLEPNDNFQLCRSLDFCLIPVAHPKPYRLFVWLEFV